MERTTSVCMMNFAPNARLGDLADRRLFWTFSFGTRTSEISAPARRTAMLVRGRSGIPAKSRTSSRRRQLRAE